MEQVAMKDLEYESNRKYGRDAGFEQLVESIREYGILEPLLVRPLGEGRYRVIAGRRRAEAAAQAELEAVDCIVREDDTDDEELALVENINRLEMHPLDEADIFRRMKEGGATVGYLAMHFARSRGMIAQRLRLSGLNAPAREMFREERLEITGAVLLSGLPEEDQGAFCEKYAGKEATHWQVQEYIVRTQKRPLYPVMDFKCVNCKERTRNGDAGLFEEEYRFDDVCLNPECYQATWHELIELALEEAAGEHRGSGEVIRIAFDGSIPGHLYEKTGAADFGGKTYEILKPQGYILSREATNRKKNTYWRVSYFRKNIQVKRCGYERREAYKKSEAKRMEGSLVSGYGKALLTTLGTELNEAPEQIARDLAAAGIDGWDAKNLIREGIRQRVEERNLAQKGSRNYAALYFRHLVADGWEGLLEKYTGSTDIENVPLNAEAQGLFHLLINRVEPYNMRMPAPEDLEKTDQSYRQGLFWEYAGMDDESYRALYLEEARKVVEQSYRKNTGKNGGTVTAPEEDEQ